MKSPSSIPKKSDQTMKLFSWIPTVSDRMPKASSSSSIRKTFKKLYEQKDLVRNNKDQYGVICDNIWQQSYQRLSLTKISKATPSGDPKGSLNTSCSEPKVPLVPRMGHSALTPSKEYVIDAQSLHLDFFDIKCSKKNPNSKNRYTNQILSTTCYEQNWL